MQDEHPFDIVPRLKRFVGASLDEFERFFAHGVSANLSEAAYPPCCLAESGPIRFRLVKAGGLILEVRRCDAEPTGDFRLDVLFKTGSCPFGDAVDLACFWNGAVADAFGMPRGPLPDREQLSILDDLRGQLPTTARPNKGGRRRLPTVDAVAASLAKVVRGQDFALCQLASIAVAQLAKRSPLRPAAALLLGPSGVGKTSTVQALPEVLAAVGWPGAHVHRIDCNELTDDYDVHRFLGSAPGLVGYAKTPPLAAALQQEGCILLLDEIDKAHPAVQEAFNSVLDTGRIMAPDGTAVSSPGAIITMTSTSGADELESRLHRIEATNEHAVDREARAHLREQGWSSELVGRLDTIAVFRALHEQALREAATDAIRRLAEEYGLVIASLPVVLADVVVDLAEDTGAGARGLQFGARRLLSGAFAKAVMDGVESRVTLDAGPPPRVVPC